MKKVCGKMFLSCRVIVTMKIFNTIWPENLTGIKFDEIASKLHNKNMTDFIFDEMLSKKTHSK